MYVIEMKLVLLLKLKQRNVIVCNSSSIYNNGLHVFMLLEDI